MSETYFFWFGYLLMFCAVMAGIARAWRFCIVLSTLALLVWSNIILN